eukprot:GILI01005697.1.p1 GENE.GILI01005697.1~~GILI01005697.1.p1  ORF type:complete len:210 (-),score=36.92 GILI01005697.1:156-785(-)
MEQDSAVVAAPFVRDKAWQPLEQKFNSPEEEQAQINDSDTAVGRYYLCCAEQKCRPNSQIRELLLHFPFADTLTFSHNFLGDRGVTPLTDALLLNNRLIYLDLSFNGIRDGGAVDISARLKHHPSITSLILNTNQISAGSGFTALMELVRANQHIYQLEVKNNKMSEKHAQMLADAADENALNRPRLPSQPQQSCLFASPQVESHHDFE